MSWKIETKQELPPEEVVEAFTNFMKKFGINLIQYFAYAVTDRARKGIIPEPTRLKGAIVENPEFGRLYLNKCWFGGDFFRWIIPDNETKIYKDADAGDELIRPKTAIGPYGYEKTSFFTDGTIVHGIAESYEIHFSLLFVWEVT